MHFQGITLSRKLGVVFGVLAVTLALGQQDAAAQANKDKTPPGSVHRMVLLQGPNRTVHYIASGNLAVGDRLAAYELERAENELAYLRNLQHLKQQYVQSERTMEPQRLYVQEQLYGTQISYGGRSMSWGNYSPYPTLYTYPLYSSYGYGGGYGMIGGYGGRGGFGGAVGGSVGSSSYNVVRSLQYGMGDEGRLKNAMVQVIARDASADSAAAAVRYYRDAANRAAASSVLARDLSLTPPRPAPAPMPRSPAPPTEPTFTKGRKLTIWAGKDKYTGTVRDDRPGWLVLQTDKAEVSIRKSEITRSEVPSKK